MKSVRRKILDFYADFQSPVHFSSFIRSKLPSLPNTCLHIGSYLAEEHSLYESLGFEKCFYVEPIPHYAKELKLRFTDESVIQAAVSGACGCADFYITEKDDSSSLLIPQSFLGEDFRIRNAISVQTFSLACLLTHDSLKNQSWGLMVLDIQGSEGDVFENASRHSLSKTYIIVVEASNPPRYNGSQPYSQLELHLRNLGFVPVRSIQKNRLFHGDVLFLNTRQLGWKLVVLLRVYEEIWTMVHNLFRLANRLS